MTKGHVFLAQNSDVNYVRQACALALSIKKFNNINATCLITNDEVPGEYRHVFDHVISIPWSDLAKDSTWKIENRWKVIHASPFKENIVYDTDMLLLNTNDHWWKYFKDYDLFFTTAVHDYRGNVITDNFYRKTFTANLLPNIYTGCYYFKRNNKAFEFFKWLDIIINNWEEFYKMFLKNKRQPFVSMDVSAALALRFMGLEEYTISNKNIIPSFIHMKPMIQGWINCPKNWLDVLHSHFNNDCQLRIANLHQQGLFHYVEDEFLTNDILLKLSK